MSFTETTVYTTELTWHKPQYLMWEPTEVTSLEYSQKKSKKPLQILLKMISKSGFQDQNQFSWTV